jgi:hypothetical protein
MATDYPTLVLITIDAEPSEKFQNGCFEHCVNGVWPSRLDEWIELGIAAETPLGYAFTEGHKEVLRELRCRERSTGRVLDSEQVQRRITVARGGLPSIFRSASRFGAPCVVFLDAAQMYIYGERTFQEACDLTQLSGNDLQLHLHPAVLRAPWYHHHGIERPDDSEVQDWPRDVLWTVHRIATDDMTRLSGTRPIAYRAGAYRISETLIDILVELGFEFDFSYDLLNRKGNGRLDSGRLNGNAPLAFRGLWEIPITAFAYRSPGKLKRFVANPKPFSRIQALRAFREAGLRVITYILHSYSLMKTLPDPESDTGKAGRLGLDSATVEHFEDELRFMQESGEFEFVDVPELKARIQVDPDILRGPAPLVQVR